MLHSDRSCGDADERSERKMQHGPYEETAQQGAETKANDGVAGSKADESECAERLVCAERMPG
jgi:hypothetical protein